MADHTEASTASQCECEQTAGRVEIADGLNGVVDGILTGAIRLGTEADAVSVDVPFVTRSSELAALVVRSGIIPGRLENAVLSARPT